MGDGEVYRIRSAPSKLWRTNSGNANASCLSLPKPSSITGISMAPPDRVTLPSSVVVVVVAVALSSSSVSRTVTSPNSSALLGRCHTFPLAPAISIPRSRLETHSQKKSASAWSLRFCPCSPFRRAVCFRRLTFGLLLGFGLSVSPLRAALLLIALLVALKPLTHPLSDSVWNPGRRNSPRRRVQQRGTCIITSLARFKCLFVRRP
mmetsp:Transcript_53207/g.64098  ORF Transcript_53207/g.64098 Transcript_53207/m.64098 type:complete len:206 (+) Transcript_53207:214-831(+)